MFISNDGGVTFTRETPSGDLNRPRVAAYNGVFYALASNNAGAFTVESSVDGVTWTTLTSERDHASDLLIDDTGFYVAHQNGMLTSPDGITWTDTLFSEGIAVELPQIVDIGGTLIMDSGAAVIYSSTNHGTNWIHHDEIAKIEDMYQMASAGNFAVAIVNADTPQGQGHFVTAIENGSWDLSPLSKIADTAFSLVTTPVGVLIADGSLGRDPTNIENREHHTTPFLAGATDGGRVVIVDSKGASISLDGGETFTAAGRF